MQYYLQIHLKETMNTALKVVFKNCFSEVFQSVMSGGAKMCKAPKDSILWNLTKKQPFKEHLTKDLTKGSNI